MKVLSDFVVRGDLRLVGKGNNLLNKRVFDEFVWFCGFLLLEILIIEWFDSWD